MPLSAVSKSALCENAQLALAGVMVVSLVLVIGIFPVGLIWIRQPIGNIAATTADVFAFVFGFAFFCSLALVVVGQQNDPESVAQKNQEVRTCSVGRVGGPI